MLTVLACASGPQSPNDAPGVRRFGARKPEDELSCVGLLARGSVPQAPNSAIQMCALFGVKEPQRDTRYNLVVCGCCMVDMKRVLYETLFSFVNELLTGVGKRRPRHLHNHSRIQAAGAPKTSKTIQPGSAA